MTDTTRDLIQRMADKLDHYKHLLRGDRRRAHPLAIEARAYLAQPEPEGPTDEEIMALMPQQMHEDLAYAAQAMAEQAGTDSTRVKGLMRIALNRHVVDHARAVLARWGNHPAKPDTSLQPIPVSERMPEPVPLSKRPWEREEWCDEQGRCWWFDSADPGWVFDTPETCRHWASFVLPAHALPLATHV